MNSKSTISFTWCLGVLLALCIYFASPSARAQSFPEKITAECYGGFRTYQMHREIKYHWINIEKFPRIPASFIFDLKSRKVYVDLGFKKYSLQMGNPQHFGDPIALGIGGFGNYVTAKDIYDGEEWFDAKLFYFSNSTPEITLEEKIFMISPDAFFSKFSDNPKDAQGYILYRDSTFSNCKITVQDGSRLGGGVSRSCRPPNALDDVPSNIPGGWCHFSEHMNLDGDKYHCTNIMDTQKENYAITRSTCIEYSNGKGGCYSIRGAQRDEVYNPVFPEDDSFMFIEPVAAPDGPEPWTRREAAEVRSGKLARQDCEILTGCSCYALVYPDQVNR